MRRAKTVCITLPPDLLTKAQKLAVREHRTMSELFREALRRYMAESAASERGLNEAKKPGEGNEPAPRTRESDVLHSFRMEKDK